VYAKLHGQEILKPSMTSDVHMPCKDTYIVLGSMSVVGIPMLPRLQCQAALAVSPMAGYMLSRAELMRPWQAALIR